MGANKRQHLRESSRGVRGHAPPGEILKIYLFENLLTGFSTITESNTVVQENFVRTFNNDSG